jgi:hypothetical protein
MRPKHTLKLGAALVLVATSAVCTGCDLNPSHLVSFGAGYLVGQVVGPPLEVVTVTRACYRDGEQVPCPEPEQAEHPVP